MTTARTGADVGDGAAGPVVVVGAGLAGVACARVLVGAGVPVELVDRGRRVGGRMASRRYDGRPADIGASYLTVSDPGFEAVVRGWEEAGLARPWTDTFGVASPDGRGEPTTGPVRWGTPGGIRTLVEALAVDLPVRSATTVERVSADADGTPTVDGRRASAVVLAMPDPQAVALLDGEVHGEAVAALDAEYEAVLALTAVYGERCWEELPDGLFVNDDPVLAWVADDGRRRCDGAPVLVAHSTDRHARAHLADPPAGGPAMLEALQRHVGAAQQPLVTAVHRWTCAKPAGGRDATYLLSGSGVGACGDSWSQKPRVEAAWLSGTALGHALVESLG